MRRLEALTGNVARHAINKQLQTVRAAAAELKSPLEEMPARVAALLDERKKLERELGRRQEETGDGRRRFVAGAPSDIRSVGDIKLMARVVSGIDIKDLKSLADEGKKQLGSGVVALVAVSEDGKASIVIGVTADLTARISAVDLVRKASEVLGGKGGGGKPDMAQAGGPDGGKADAALAAVEAALWLSLRAELGRAGRHHARRALAMPRGSARCWRWCTTPSAALSRPPACCRKRLPISSSGLRRAPF